MLSKYRSVLLSKAVRPPPQSCAFCTSARLLREELASGSRVDYEAKYAEKLQRRAQESGKTAADLRNELREQEKERRRQRLALESQKASTSSEATANASPSPSAPPPAPAAPTAVRKDSSPVKPLDSILNLDKLLETPHTPEQLSVLWKAYHASRSGGTGRGFLSAAVPPDAYAKMLSVAARYPTFVVPVPRPAAPASTSSESESGSGPGTSEPAYEFYFMEWGFHGAPPAPRVGTELFAAPPAAGAGANPQTTTVLFTPLQEYKLRGAFATPYLVLTHYADLARSHGAVLLRGELTPSPGGGDARYMLSQQDAQLLAVAVQRFYLWSEGESERAALLRAFHESPAAFKWEELLKHAQYTL
ncbi:ATP11-domain-containing protein [Wolfiporia cocos MD-104 SS10]|uniref:ATP11-domain-containing protein n=1 Tax=Wolfiporia cocos (strain MD-104) TaxID=742152 RepID=A0A2H3IU69_WOLCO|nr:ATP11-domain-containing protein [Wolfiporia cocos MD-104 SS10]